MKRTIKSLPAFSLHASYACYSVDVCSTVASFTLCDIQSITCALRNLGIVRSTVDYRICQLFNQFFNQEKVRIFLHILHFNLGVNIQTVQCL